ncbi:fumarylacetoacetate hydrolase family protein [Pseudomonadota bacterium]
MKLASLKSSGRDGTLIVVDKTLSRYITVPNIATTLQQALESWSITALQLKTAYEAINNNPAASHNVNINELASPLPRSYQWLDGSAYLTHVERVRKARGAEMPPSFLEDPLMYQGGSDTFLGPRDDILVGDESWGIDFESEVAIITDDVPQGVSEEEAGKHIKLIMLVNDVSLRNLIPSELAKGFGFLHGKPPTTFSAVAVTPDELGDAWHDSKLHLPLRTTLNGEKFGDPDAGSDMQFSFAQLIQHAAKTRPLGAGTIIGSGTVSNADVSRGCSCLAEKRVLEIINHGEATTPFMSFGDQISIEMRDNSGQSIFGSINQVVKACRS